MHSRRAPFSDSHFRLSDFSFKDSQFVEFLRHLLCRIEGVGEDVDVLRAVGPGRLNLHGVVVGIGEDAVLGDVLDGGGLLEGGLLPVVGEYHKESVGLRKGKPAAYDGKRRRSKLQMRTQCSFYLLINIKTCCAIDLIPFTV